MVSLWIWNFKYNNFFAVTNTSRLGKILLKSYFSEKLSQMVTPKGLSVKIQFSTFGWVSLALEIAELDTEMGNECFLVLRVDHLENDAGKRIIKIILQILSELEILMVMDSYI